jgi:hypothetical protein
VDGVDDLGAVDALQIDRCDPEVGVPKLPLDDDQRDALVSHFDGVGVAQLVRRESTADARESCGAVELLASGGLLPVPAGSRAVDYTQQGSSAKVGAELKPRL